MLTGCGVNLSTLLPADWPFDVERLIADCGTIRCIMASPGVYVFCRNGYDAYVGRGDSDGIARMRKSYRAARYDQLPVFFDPAAICPVVVSANHGGREPEMMIPSGATRIGFVQPSSTMVAAIGDLCACGVPCG